MKTKIKIKSIFGKVLFEYETEDNTILKTINEANLSGANLYEADLSGADLYEADLREANLSGAYFSGANLYEADLSEANLSGAYLYGADLRGADLREANLYGANLRGADLREANLSGANLSGANNAEYVFAQTIIVPEGDIIGWKLCKDNVIVKLLIPKEARRSNATGRKCRAEYVEVLEIINPNDKRKKIDVAISKHDNKTEYRVGEIVKCHEWNEDRWEECAGGIHFFITKEEAINYV